MEEIAKKIDRLKKEKNAVVLAHLYQPPQIQAVADFVGDSLDLSRKARGTDADVIVFCGVFFMGETAKILSPEKTVLLPEPGAGCPMADMVTADGVRRLRAAHPGAAVVCYVNSGAAVKAESDICCTSSNAVAVVRSLAEDEVIFVPDRNLGSYVAGRVPEKRFWLHDGFCPTHQPVTPDDIARARADAPGAPVLVHPECTPETVAAADFAGSTAQIIDEVLRSPDREFIIGTESGILHRLKALAPDKTFHALGGGMVCPDMKKTTPEKVLYALENGCFEVSLPGDVIAAAQKCLNRMLAV